MTSSVGIEFPKELARCKGLVGFYRSMGPDGAFAAAAVSAIVESAESAWESQDVVELVRTFQAMKECE